METARTIPAVRAAVAAARATAARIGLVPTMGALHAGHLSLIEAARRAADLVVVSIFVNPTQFGPTEDFERYPRDEQRDLRVCAEHGVGLVFLPHIEQIYPEQPRTVVHVAKLTETLCGPHRPGHFDGVATVVAKLFNIVQPDAAYFGQKDAQQLAVIRRLVRDLDFPIEIVGCPTVRESDGLALSSRNQALTDEQRSQALGLSGALREARRRFDAGERGAAALCAVMRKTLAQAGIDRVDYASIVDADDMQVVEHIERPALAAIAVHIGRTRLIDNVQLDPHSIAG